MRLNLRQSTEPRKTGHEKVGVLSPVLHVALGLDWESCGQRKPVEPVKKVGWAFRASELPPTQQRASYAQAEPFWRQFGDATVEGSAGLSP
jgi:hypothetical protein